MAGAAPETGVEALFAAEMGRLLGPDFPTALGLAVSGGGDSMAMLALAHGWARVMGVRLRVATVDHGLRPDSGAEAALVAAECVALGHSHSVLSWHWDGEGNLQDAARRARLQLISGWAADWHVADGAAATGMTEDSRGIIGPVVLFAHTQDDVAETLLMRLARGAGVAGLAAMADRRWIPAEAGGGDGFWQVRPLLPVARADLRHVARVLRVPFAEDPSNADARFDRARARAALAALAPLGLTAAGLAATARRLGDAAEAVRARAAQASAAAVVPTPPLAGHLLIGRDAFAALERETQLRLLGAGVQWITGDGYRPRGPALSALLDRVLAGGGGTLHGAQVAVERDHLRLFREFAAVAAPVTDPAPGELWDRVWRLEAPLPAGATLRALGPDGWCQIAEKPAETAPYASMLSAPAVFRGDRLLSCPALGVGPELALRPVRGASSFAAFLQLR
jgi:tRNA(Ile)-lysidine synthase